jgi:hypothetical protein
VAVPPNVARGITVDLSGRPGVESFDTGIRAFDTALRDNVRVRAVAGAAGLPCSEDGRHALESGDRSGPLLLSIRLARVLRLEVS